MGVNSSQLTTEELDEYSELLYLKKAEILQLFKKCKNLGPEVSRDRLYGFDELQIGLEFPELRWNPFLDRILYVFSSKKDNKLSFEDILDLFSAFHPACPEQVKAEWVFQMLDFDGDNQIGREDIVEIITRLTATTKKRQTSADLPDMDKFAIADKILSDLDLDKTGGIIPKEFTLAVLKMSDFKNCFKLKV